jgi:hypothetical protein
VSVFFFFFFFFKVVNERICFVDQARRKQGMNGSTPARFSGKFPILEAVQFVDLRPWVDQVTYTSQRCHCGIKVEVANLTSSHSAQTPITVSHKFPMEQTVQLFRKMVSTIASSLLTFTKSRGFTVDFVIGLALCIGGQQQSAPRSPYEERCSPTFGYRITSRNVIDYGGSSNSRRDPKLDSNL